MVQQKHSPHAAHQRAEHANDISDVGQPRGMPTAGVARYTCPMHLEVVSDQPGECPKCGMALDRWREGRVLLELLAAVRATDTTSSRRILWNEQQPGDRR